MEVDLESQRDPATARTRIQSKEGTGKKHPDSHFSLISHPPGGSHWPNPSRTQMMQPKGVSHPGTEQDGGGGDMCVCVCANGATSRAVQLDLSPELLRALVFCCSSFKMPPHHAVADGCPGLDSTSYVLIRMISPTSPLPPSPVGTSPRE